VATQPNGAEEGRGRIATRVGTTVAQKPAPTAGRRGVGEAKPAAGQRPSLGGRAVAFLRACWAELQRMQWPDREHTAQATAIVLGFVIVAGIYLAIADLISQKIVNLIF
jgi:preprotein translocase SecE subunit